jgi:tetraacyldisaccharide 4'-kinase
MFERVAIYHRRLVLEGCRTWFDYILMLILIPCGHLYAFIGRVRVWMYDKGFLSAFKAHVPVISVGNLGVGGTGKTPVVSWILDLLHQHGYRAAVISRGYASSPGAGAKKKARRVETGGQNGRVHAAVTYGDEPVLLALRHPETPVVVSSRRADGVRYVQKYHEVDVIVLDDAFQHLALERDLNLVLLDACHPLGNGRVLPAGLLRERSSALSRADLLLLTRYIPGIDIPDMPVCSGEAKPRVRVAYHLAPYAIDLEGRRIALDELTHLRLGAFAGTANPDDFFASLHRYGIHPLITVPLADHVMYTPEKLEFIRTRCTQAEALVTTEKDAVKIDPDNFPIPCYYVPLGIEPLEQDILKQALLDVLA